MSIENGRDLVRKIRSLARAHPAIDLARLEFIGLSDIREAYSDRWPLERRRIRETAADFIAKRLRATDVLVPCEAGFLILFGSDQHQAEVIARRVGDELGRFFLGDTHPPLGVQTSVERVPSKQLSNIIATLPNSGIDTAKRGQASLSDCLGDPSIDFRFLPAWSSRRQAICTYYLQHQRRDPISEHPVCEMPQAELDELALASSESALRALHACDRQAVVVADLHLSVLMKPANRTRLLSTMKKFDKRFVRHRAIRILGVNSGFPVLYLDEVMGLLSPFAARVMLALEHGCRELPMLTAGNFWGGGFVFEEEAKGVSPKVIPDLKALIACAHRRRRQVFFQGPLSRDLAAMCADFGVDLLSSHSVWPCTSTPPGVAHWPADNLKDQVYLDDLMSNSAGLVAPYATAFTERRI